MTSLGVTVAIPTRNAGVGFSDLIKAIWSQSRAPDEVIVIDSGSSDDTVHVAVETGCRVIRIAPRDFNHGGTRNVCWREARSDLIVFTVQDAFPASDWLERCVQPFHDHPQVAAVGCRQMPTLDAATPDQASRETMYPDEGSIRVPSDLSALGLRALFLSNAAAGYRRSALDAVGGFNETVIVAEDMEIAYRLLRQGYWIAYAADSRVTHSHSYRVGEQLRRNFDMGVFFATNPEIGGLASGRALGRLAREFLRKGMRRARLDERIRFFFDALARAVGMFLGRRYRILPGALRRRLTRTPSFWPSRDRS